MEQNCRNYSSILKDYLREVKYVENINKHFEFIVCDIWDRKSLLIECRNAVDKDDYVKRFEILYELIKDFLKKIEDGELKDISNFIFPIDYVFNIFEVKTSLRSYYRSFIRCCHGIKLDKENDKKLLDLYERNIKYLVLLFDKINVEFNSEKFASLISGKRLYLKEEYVLKVCNNVIKLDPISSKYPTLEEYHKSKNNLSN